MQQYNENFCKAFDSLIKLEGEYSNNKYDSGGATKYGISKHVYPSIDIKNLTMRDAQQIYFDDYWSPYNYYAIENNKIAEKIFHNTVNMGGKQSHLVLQRALRAVGFILIEDGVLGKQTIAAVNKSDPSVLIVALRSESAGFYRMLSAIKPKNKVFINGWLKRAYM